MSDTFRIVLCIVVFLFCCLIVELISSKKLSLKYSLLWLVSCIVLILLVAFPKLIDIFSSLIGVYSSLNALYATAIFIILIILLSVTVIISKQSDRIKRLAQNNAILEKRVRRLEEALNRKGED